MSRRRSYRKSRKTLRGANLCGADLRGHEVRLWDLHGAHYDQSTKWPDNFDYRSCGALGPEADLRGKNFRRLRINQPYLWNTNLTETDLREVRITELYCIGCRFKRADLSGANLDGSRRIKNSTFKEANLAGASVSGSGLVDTDLSWADLRNTRWSHSSFRRVCFRGSDLRNSNLNHCHFAEVDLRGADLRGSDFSTSQFFFVHYDEVYQTL